MKKETRKKTKRATHINFQGRTIRLPASVISGEGCSIRAYIAYTYSEVGSLLDEAPMLYFRESTSKPSNMLEGF